MAVKKTLILWALVISLAFSACPSSANKEEGGESKLWLVINNSLADPKAFTALGGEVYVWQGNLPAGSLCFNGDAKPSGNGVWYGPQKNDDAPLVNGTAVSMYHNSNNWYIGTAGYYTITANVPLMKVSFQYTSGVLPDPTVTGITVTPVTADVNQGGNATFMAAVAGTNNPPQTVTWSIVETDKKAGTAITAGGVLTVAADEPSGKTFTIQASSTLTGYTGVYGQAIVTVVDTNSTTVSAITVMPATANVIRGESRTFTASVTGSNNPPQTVTWSIVETDKKAGTAITAGGVLTVAADEPAEKTLTIRASSTLTGYTHFYGDAAVTVKGANVPPDQNQKGRYGNYYEIFVGSFYSSKNNGMGDLRGIIQKLDYLNDGNPNSNTSLSIDGIWLMPINPSPSYHKYDVRDYKAVDPAYGTMQDFEDLIAACNQRGIRVIIDLVVNHTSTQHPWFERARNNSDPQQAYYQAYYNIANTKINNSYYALGSTGKWYEAVFWDQMPDLNYDNPQVKAEMQSIVDFWIGKGVAGFRLDAVKHIYDDQTKSVQWLKWFVDYCKSKKSDVYIVGEVWDSAATIQNFYSSGIPSNFNFIAAQDIIPKSVSAQPISASNFVSHVVNWNSQIKAKNSEAIDAPFLTNHDIDRFATTIGTDSVRLKMAASLLLFMPGNPFIYYGEELGMTGDLPKDENVRGPMIWSKTTNVGKTNGPSGNDKPYWNVSGVAEQLADSNSILRFYIDAMKLKNLYPSIHWGTPVTITTTEGGSIAAYRVNSTRAGEKSLAVVHNITNSGKTVTINGAAALGGSLSAQGAAAAKPALSGATLTMPAYTTAIIEY